ncbi:hypothetical protein KP509_04G100500 [Ceratopteris richardii]|uniref:Uncharacterized protein n=1 Tax=Ceratopteris richardii TaxID=49495 RepID=A0A8T2V3B6_CERRI|nr:hypothetical protein KP509_04G100500 [Ceratopteris richardii]
MIVDDFFVVYNFSLFQYSSLPWIQSWGCSNSLDTTWTDSKHSSYLDFMEANFVQNMYARCYCEEDLCGGVPYQHSHGLLHQGQNQSIETVEENDYYSAESTNRSQRMMQIAMYDFGKWNWRNVMGLKSPTASTRILLENPWVQHFRAGYSPTRSQVCTSSKNDGAKGIKRSRSGIPPAPGPLHSHQMGHNITGTTLIFCQVPHYVDCG